MGAASTIVLGPEGGTLGRSKGNDWVLPDPERYVSGKHALIESQADQFYLTDLSTNGVYLNDAEEPIGRGTSQALCHGDLLRIGAFSIAVAIEEKKASAGATGAAGPLMDIEAQLSNDDSGIFRPDATYPHGDKADLDAALMPDQTGIERSLAVDLDTPELTKPQPDVSQEIELLPSDELRDETRLELESDALNAPAPAPAVSADDQSEEMPAALRRLEEQAHLAGDPPGVDQPVPAQGPVAISKPTPDATSAGALALLLKGAGIDPSAVGNANQAEVLQNVGRMLREAVLGVMEVLHNRANMKNSFRLSQTMIRPVDNNPLKFSAGVDEALISLFSHSGSKFLPPVDSLKLAFEDIKDHNLAYQTAMREAFNEFISRFDPDDLQERFNRGLKRGALMGATNKMKYWDLYRELYEVMTQHSDQAYPRLFGEVFAQAYEESKEKLKQIREKKLRKEVSGTARKQNSK